MSYIVIAITSYLVYVFVNEAFTSLHSPQNQLARRRLARWCAGSALIAGVGISLTIAPLTESKALMTAMLLTALLASPAVMLHVYKKLANSPPEKTDSNHQ